MTSNAATPLVNSMKLEIYVQQKNCTSEVPSLHPPQVLSNHVLLFVITYFDSTLSGITSSPILCLSLCFFLCFLLDFERDVSFLSPSLSSSAGTSEIKIPKRKFIGFRLCTVVLRSQQLHFYTFFFLDLISQKKKKHHKISVLLLSTLQTI